MLNRILCQYYGRVVLDGCDSWHLSYKSFYVRLPLVLDTHVNFMYRPVLQQDLVTGMVKR